MGSSCINNENNKINVQQKGHIIKLYGCSDETHESLKYQNNGNLPIIEDTTEYIITKQKSSQINEKIINNSKPKIISEPMEILSVLSLKEERDYEISNIKESDKEYILLQKLYNIFQDNEINKNKKNVIINYNNGEKYFGECDKENHKNGRGIQIFNNNNIYYGFWENNKMNGIGKMIKFYQKINNLDIIFNDNSMPFYFGEWKNNLEDGNGEEIWIDKSIYKGGYKEGLKEGKGNLLLSDGTEYNGDFYQGKIEGKGKIIYKDGRIYEGNWLNNKMNGEGQFNWPDGRMYKGNYLNNYKNGYGEFFWPDGKIYKGMWVNGKQNGKGKLYNKEYDIWINGIWKDGKRIKEKNE
jgi:hypothetical protein